MKELAIRRTSFLIDPQDQRLPSHFSLLVQHGFTPLHVAAKATAVSKPALWAYDSAKCLLEAGAEFHAVSKGGQSCVGMAKNDAAMVKLLLNHGATLTSSDLVSAVEAGQVNIFREMLHRRTEVGQSLDLDLRPALCATVMLFTNPFYYTEDHQRQSIDLTAIVEMARLLVNCGADPLPKYRIWNEHSGSPCIQFINDSPLPDEKACYKEVTFSPELILKVENLVLEPFLVSGLSVNCRNKEGLTILQAA